MFIELQGSHCSGIRPSRIIPDAEREITVKIDIQHLRWREGQQW